ncbi:hemagglutinin repeat-containing protein [Leclercia adecarboxylata]|nr:hemagglutinin repeat-containing protein [Leclercia adecarboxylata]MEB6380851.1 hemagglutinin repeat-containing protein [Leclercia adecarboxylata]
MQAGLALALDQAKGTSDSGNTNTVGVSASLGSQSSKSSSHTQSETTKGSSLSAGNNVTIKATGSDITVAGSQIKAGQDVTLDAARDVNLLASQDTQQTTGKNSSSGGSLGVGLGVGSGGAGLHLRGGRFLGQHQRQPGQNAQRRRLGPGAERDIRRQGRL